MSTNRRVAQIVRQRRKQRLKRVGNAPKVLRWLGCGFSVVFVILIVFSTSAIGAGIAIYASYAQDLPNADEIVASQNQTFRTTIIYDRTGQYEIYEVIDPLGGDRRLVALDELPPYLIEATIAFEDASFYDNPGFNVRGMLRAMWNNLTTDNTLQGGSSITQQLVKNTVIPFEERDDVSIDRKMKEIILAGELSRLYSKDEILAMYLNTNFYGSLAYGIEAAARVYFDKSARDLTIAEATMLVAIPQSPYQTPHSNFEAAKTRQRLVLDTMVREGYLTIAQADSIFAEPLIIRPFEARFEEANTLAPHFAIYAQQEAEAVLNDLGLDGARMVSSEGLRIYTTLDLDIQHQLECVARSHVKRLAIGDEGYVEPANNGQNCIAAQFLPPLPENFADNPRTVTNAAGIVMNAKTGEVVAMLGSLDFRDPTIDGNFNNAITAQRQPASTFKPFVYLTAFFNPINNSIPVTPATMTYDVETRFNNGAPEPYIPQNIDLQFHGPVSVREALAKSYNVPAVQVLNWVGIGEVLRTAHAMGINSMDGPLSAYGLSLALGTAEASLLDMTYAYNVLNNAGYMVGAPVRADQARPGYRQLNPTVILRIEAADGRTLWEYGRETGTFDRRPIIEAGMAYLITDILADREARLSNSFERGNALELSRPAAAKTGTSDDFRDSWTIGYTPQYTVGIWIGNNNNDTMQDVTGLTGAGFIWHSIMEYIHARDSLPIESWQQPPSIAQQNVCLWSGLRPTPSCPQVSELFYYDATRGVDYRPQQFDTYWQEIRVNVCNNTLATVYSPTGCVEPQVFFIYPDELKVWADSARSIVQPPTAYDIAGSFSDFSRVVITSPAFLDRVSGQIEIRGNAGDDNFKFFHLDWGEGNSPDRWERLTDSQTTSGRDISLGIWDTRTLEDGLYTLRLNVVRNDNSLVTVYQQVTVDNAPPTIRWLTPLQGEVYSVSENSAIDLVVEPIDNYQVDYVEFYRDGERIGEVTEAPYLYPLPISGSGRTTLWAVVVDQAGNTAESERIEIQLAP